MTTRLQTQAGLDQRASSFGIWQLAKASVELTTEREGRGGSRIYVERRSLFNGTTDHVLVVASSRQILDRHHAAHV